MTSIELFFDDYEDFDDPALVEIARMRRSLRDASNPLELESQIFLKNFRLSKDAFCYLFQEIEDKLKPCKNTRAVPNILKLATVLRFCAHGSYQLSLGNDFNIGIAQSTASLVLKEVLGIIENHVCPKWIKFQYTEEEERRAKIYFFEKSGIPNVVGCLDGTHIKIIGPGKDVRHLYYNRKGFFSLNALIVCDHLMYIKYLDAKHPGASHDSNIWNMSTLKAKLAEDYRNGRNDFRLLGDGGYPLAPYLMTPYRNAEGGSVQARFNKKHAQGRNIIERTIGVLKGRFRCTLRARELHYKPEKATQITNVCAALHNICIKYRVEVPEQENIQDILDESIPNNDQDIESLNDNFNEGSRIRDTISSFM